MQPTSNTSAPVPVHARSARPLRAAGAALAALLVLLAAGCTQDLQEGEQPGVGIDVTEPEQGIAEAGEAQLAPGEGVQNPGGPPAGDDLTADVEANDRELVDGAFAAIPLPTAAQPFSGASVEDDVTVQSFEVIATSPEQLIDYYRTELPELGWAEGEQEATTEGEPEQIRATWTKDGQTLLVTATGRNGNRDSQLTLQLSGV